MATKNKVSKKTSRKKQTKKLTEIVIVQDRSGSMIAIAEDMVGGFMNFIKEQKKIDAPCVVSLYQFDDKFDVVYEGVPLEEINNLELEPRGMTALLDGVGKSIALVKERHKKLAKSKKPEQVVFVVITDGYENYSKEYTREQIKSLVTQQEGECTHCGHVNPEGWQFVFLGANIDSFGEAGNVGFKVNKTANWNYSATGTRAVYSALNKTIGSYRSGTSHEVSLSDVKTSDGTLKED